MNNLTFPKIIQNSQIRMYQMIVKLDLFLIQFMIITVNLIDEMSIKIYQLFKLLFQQTSHTFLFTLLLLLILFGSVS